MANNLRSLFQGCAVLGGIANVILVYLLQQTWPPRELRWLVGISALVFLVTAFLALSRARRWERIEAVPYLFFALGFILLMASYVGLFYWSAP